MCVLWYLDRTSSMATRAGIRPAYLNSRPKRGYQNQLYETTCARDTDSIRKHISACVRWDHERTVLHVSFQLVFKSHGMLGCLRHFENPASRDGSHEMHIPDTHKDESFQTVIVIDGKHRYFQDKAVDAAGPTPQTLLAPGANNL